MTHTPVPTEPPAYGAVLHLDRDESALVLAALRAHKAKAERDNAAARTRGLPPPATWSLGKTVELMGRLKTATRTPPVALPKNPDPRHNRKKIARLRRRLTYLNDTASGNGHALAEASALTWALNLIDPPPQPQPPQGPTMTDTTTQPTIEPGAMVRVTEDTPDLSGRAHRAKGFEFEVEDVYPGLPDDQHEPGQINIPFVEGSTAGGYNNVTLPVSVLEVVKTPEQMRARTLPTPDTINKFLISSLLEEDHGIDINETQVNDGVVHCYGTTDDGLTFGFSVKIDSIYPTDL